MVAYNFQRRFVEPIRAGTKCQTIRADRKRHALAGELLHLYIGMRTARCERIIPNPLCLSVNDVRLIIGPTRVEEVLVIDAYGGRDPNSFARLDGFEDAAEMAEFWHSHHPGIDRFSGVLITWEPPKCPI